MNLDELSILLGQFGPYQRQKYLLMCLFSLLSAFHALNMVFVGAQPRHWCSIDHLNLSGTPLSNISHSEVQKLFLPEDDKCAHYDVNARLVQLKERSYNFSDVMTDETGSNVTKVACTHGHSYAKDKYKSTIVSEFDLVCERMYWRSTSKSIFFGGRLVGAFVFGQLSDRFGRRPMFFAGVLTLLVAGTVAALSPSMLVFVPMYFLQGAAHTGAFLVAFTLSTELVGPDYRVVAGFVLQIFYNLGYLILAGLAYFIRDWRQLELAITLPALLFGFYWWFLPESVPWLLAQGRDEEAQTIIQAAANKNGVQLDPRVLRELKAEASLRGGARRYTALDCVRTKAVAAMSLTIWSNWLVNSFVFYGIALNSENLSGDPYLNFCLIGGVGILAEVFCIAMVKLFGRRTPLVISMCLAGLVCVGAAFVQGKDTPEMKTVVKVLVLVGKFWITCSYATIYLWSAELFPTVVRNAGMGVASMSARIGGIFAPFVLDLEATWSPLPLLVFGVLSVVAGLSALTLPDSVRRSLPQTLEDLNQHTRTKRTRNKPAGPV